MQHIVLIAVGGSLGAIARYGVSTFVLGAVNDMFPWGTLIVNISGSFLIGVCAELADTALVSAHLRSFLMIGFLGAYTTFSTFSLETMNLLRDGEIKIATLNILASNVTSILLVILGVYCSRIVVKMVG